MDRYPITARSLDIHYHVNGDKFNRQYKEHLSGYRLWEAKSHATEYLVFPANMGPRLSMDETSLSMGELYTIIENKDAHGRRGTIVAMVRGTRSEDVVKVLERIPLAERKKVVEVTVDLADNMAKIVRRGFPDARLTIDRFHVQKLALEAVQNVRIKYRWEAIEKDNALRKEAKDRGEKYVPHTYENGDTEKELLARCRYALFKSKDKWSESQEKRIKIVFRNYPEIEQAYNLAHHLRTIFNKRSKKDAARLNLARWYDEVEKSGISHFRILANTIEQRYDEVLNYFIDFSTNANAEAFNAKIKSFRASMRCVADLDFFLFRLSNIYA